MASSNSSSNSSSSSVDGDSQFDAMYDNIEFSRVASGAMFLFGVIAVMILVLRRRKSMFNKTCWKYRLAFCLVSIVWLGGFFLRSTEEEMNSLRCDAYVFVVTGFCEPTFCFLLAFFLRQQSQWMSKRRKGKIERQWCPLLLTAIALVPVVVFHIVALTVTSLQTIVPMSEEQESENQNVESEGLPSSPCPIPMTNLVGTTITTLFALMLINMHAMRVAKAAINVLVTRRLHQLQALISIGMILQLIERYCLQLINVSSTVSEIWVSIYYYTVLATAGGCLWFLVLRPVLHDVCVPDLPGKVLDFVCKGRRPARVDSSEQLLLSQKSRSAEKEMLTINSSGDMYGHSIASEGDGNLGSAHSLANNNNNNNAVLNEAGAAGILSFSRPFHSSAELEAFKSNLNRSKKSSKASEQRSQAETEYFHNSNNTRNHSVSAAFKSRFISQSDSSSTSNSAEDRSFDHRSVPIDSPC